MKPPTFDQWINHEYPQLRAVYTEVQGHEPNDEWAAFQTLRRYSGFIAGLGESWTFEQMLAHERGQGAQPPEQPPPVLPITTNRRIFLAGGAAWRWKGVSAFPLCARFASGEEITPYLEAFAGFSVLRVWDYVTWPDTGWESPGVDAWRAFLGYVRARGWYVELTALTDDDPARLDPARRLIEGLADQAALFIEAGNEPTTHKNIDTAALRGVLEASGLPHASGNGDDGHWYGTYGTHHSGRDGEWPRRAHDLMEFFNGDGPETAHPPYAVPWVADEPIRPDEAGFKVLDYRAYFGACALMGAGGTFHFEGGKFGRLPTADEARCAAAALEGLNAFSADAPNGPYRRIDEQGRTLRTYVVGNCMVRVRPTTADAPEPGWRALDDAGVLWTRG